MFQITNFVKKQRGYNLFKFVLGAYGIFLEFLKQEYSEENLLFITEVKKYKKIVNIEQRKEKAEKLS